MKKFKRFVSLMLVLFMVIPLAISTAWADSSEPSDSSEPDNGVLYEQNFDNGHFYSFPKGRNCAYTLRENGTIKWVSGGDAFGRRIGDVSNRSVSLVNRANGGGDDGWLNKVDSYELIPASAFEGLTNFTVSFDMMYFAKPSNSPDQSDDAGTYTGWERFLAFVLPRQEDDKGNYIGLDWSELKIWKDSPAKGGDPIWRQDQDLTDNAEVHIYEDFGCEFAEKPFQWTIQVTATTITVTLDNGTATLSTGAIENPYGNDAIDGLTLLMIDAAVELDNIKLVNDDNQNVIYEEDFEKTASEEQQVSFSFPESFPDGRNINNNYSGGTVSVSRVSGGTGHIGDASNKSIVFSNNQDWYGAYKEILPVSAFEGLTDYTVSFDMIYHNKPGDGYGNSGWARMTSFAFPSETSGTAGNRVTLYDAKLYNSNTAYGTEGCAAVAQPYASNATYSTSGRVEFVVRAGSGANDATFSVYINGKLLSTRTNAYSGAPYGMILLVANAIIELDNIQVRNNANGKCVCYETFEEADDTAAFGNRVFSAGRQIEYHGGEMEINYHTGGTKRNYANTKDIGTIGDENNHLVTLVNRTNAWVGAYKEIIPASAFAGLTDYTISFQIRTTNPSHYLENLYGYPGTTGTQTKYTAVVADFAIMKDGTSKTANHVSFYNWKIYNTNTLLGSDGVTTYFEKANSYDGNGHIHGEMKFVVKAGSEENDATFAIYMNDVLVSTRSNAYSGAPYGMILTLNNYIMQLDDIKVHDDVKGVDTYFEDFEPMNSLMSHTTYEYSCDFSDFYTQNPNFTGTDVIKGIRNNNGDSSLVLDAFREDYVADGTIGFAASLVTKAQLQGETRYAVSFDIKHTGYPYPHTDETYTRCSYLHVGCNDGIGSGFSNMKGIWVMFYSDTGGDTFKLYNSGKEIATATAKRFSILGNTVHYTVIYDSNAKTFMMWADDRLLFNQNFSGDNTGYIGEGDIIYGLSNRNAVEIDNIEVKRGVQWLSMVGAQSSTAITNGKYAVRFVGGIGTMFPDLLDIDQMGFKVVVTSSTGKQADYYEHGIGSCDVVYQTILGNVNGVNIQYTANQFGQTHLFALTIKNIPVSVGEVTFTVEPYYVTSGKTISAVSYDIVCDGSKFDSETGAGAIQSVTPSEETAETKRLNMAFATVKSAYGNNGTSVDVDGGKMLCVSGTTQNAFNNFVTAMQSAGYSQSATNSLGNENFITFTKGRGWVVNCSFDSSANVARIILEKPGAILPIFETFDESNAIFDNSQLTQVDLNNLNAQSGMSYIIRLRDGRFIVIDGGANDYDEAKHLYDILKEQTSENAKPTIAAWFLTHAHDDHFAAFIKMAQQEDVELQAVVLNLATPSLKEITQDSGFGSTYKANIYSQIESIGAKVIYARTGQKFRFADVEIDVWNTPEDLYGSSVGIAETGNDLSVIYRMTCENQTTMFLADAETKVATALVNRYGNALKSDIMQIAHHGYTYSELGTIMATLFGKIDPDVVLWPSSELWYYHFTNSNNTDHQNQNLVARVKEKNGEIIASCFGTRVLTLPYTAQPTVQHFYNDGDVIYSQDFESVNNIYEVGWQLSDNIVDDPADAYATPNLSLTTIDGDKGIRMKSNKAYSTITFLTRDYLENVGTYTVTIDLKILSSSVTSNNKFGIWFHDSEPMIGNPEDIYEISNSYVTQLKIVIGPDKPSYNVIISRSNGSPQKRSYTEKSNNLGSLIFRMGEGVEVFIGSVTVVAGNH